MPQFSSVLELSSLDGTNGFQISGEAPGDISGRAVSGAGDLNGDGFADLIIGAFGADPNGSTSGASYVVFGAAASFAPNLDLKSLDGTNGFQISGEAGGDQSGLSVSGAGDVNGDGFADVIIGAPFADSNGISSGASYVVFGAASGFAANLDLATLDGTIGFQISGEAAGDFSSYSVSGAGDVNGDGFDDLIIGAFGADPNGISSGASYVLFGAASGFAANLDLSTLNGSNGFQISGEALYDSSGGSVSGAGDVNGDGFDDLIIGAFGADPNGSISGASYVVLGQASGFAANLDLATLDGSNGFQVSGKAALDYSGTVVNAAGDVNGDGFADLIIGAFGADPNGSTSGASYVVFGQASGFAANLDLATLDGTNGFQISGEAAYDYSGSSVSGAGDVNGDGFDDLIIGAIFAAPNGYASGASYVVFGQASGFAANLDLATLDGSNGFQISGEGVINLSGFSVAAAGDVNGDGFDDLVIGAPFGYASPNGYASGASYVVFGQKPTEAVTRIGTNASQTLAGGDFDDVLSGLGGDDVLWGHGGNDKLDGGAGDDKLHGEAGNDLIKGGTGADLIVGGAGTDIVNAGDGNDVIEATVDDGADLYYGDGGSDTIDYSALTQRVEVRLGDLFGFGTGLASGKQSGVDVLVSIENVIGSQAGDLIVGSREDNVIDGAGGRDTLTGGYGHDKFKFTSITDTGATAATRDVITDFTRGEDVIDLTAIDANTLVAGDQAFSWRGEHAFTGHAGELRFVRDNHPGHARDVAIIEGDVNGDGVADFQIELTGLYKLNDQDVLL